MRVILTPDGQLLEQGAGSPIFCLDADAEAVDIADGLPEYAVMLSLGLRPNDHVYNDKCKVREQCAVVSFGEIRSGHFKDWVRTRCTPLPTLPTLDTRHNACRVVFHATCTDPPYPIPPYTLRCLPLWLLCVASRFPSALSAFSMRQGPVAC